MRKTILIEKASVRFVSQASVRVNNVDRNTAFMLQPSIGLLFSERFYVGLTSDFCLNERFLNDVSYKPIKDETSHWETNYTGLKLEYNLKPYQAISPGIGIYTGFGKAERNFSWNNLTKQSPEYALLDKRLCQTGYFFFIEPSAFIYFNLSDRVLLKANVGYRLANFRNDVNTIGITNNKFSGLAGGVTVQLSGLAGNHK